MAIRCGSAVDACAEKAGPWILAATILGSSVAFIDSTFVNVAAPKFRVRFRPV
jgi:hypothetical protein